jgi:hypothetical protein
MGLVAAKSRHLKPRPVKVDFNSVRRVTNHQQLNDFEARTW